VLLPTGEHWHGEMATETHAKDEDGFVQGNTQEEDARANSVVSCLAQQARAQYSYLFALQHCNIKGDASTLCKVARPLIFRVGTLLGR
jgi:hypothetical protein